jgi:hypothetical protein
MGALPFTARAGVLSDLLEGGAFPFWLAREVIKLLQQRGRGGQEPPALLLGVSEPAVELVCPSRRSHTQYELQLIQRQVNIDVDIR